MGHAANPPVIDVGTLKRWVGRPDVCIFDCRFRLEDPEWGERSWESGHIPGARYAHLDQVLSSPITEMSGRHPLPDPTRLARWLGLAGVDETVRVVAYDQTTGPFAARLWWLARWLGLPDVAVLDGGWSAWVEDHGPIETSPPRAAAPRSFEPQPDSGQWLTTEAIEAVVAGRAQALVLDARQAPRYRGLEEPIDSVPGHIPGAVNLCYLDTLTPDGRFLKRAELRQRFAAVLGHRPSHEVVHSCGSGVTACLTLLAMEWAGLHGSRLYAGSYSEWIRTGFRPVAREPCNGGPQGAGRS